MHSSRSRPSPSAATRVNRGDVVRFLLAAVLVWVGAQSLAHLATVERTVRDSGALNGTAARWIAATWAVGALVTAAALLNRATARAGALATIVLASAALTLAVVAWVRGTPVACSCTTATLQHGARHHAEAVVGDTLLLVLGGITFVTTRRGRAGSKQLLQ